MSCAESQLAVLAILVTGGPTTGETFRKRHTTGASRHFLQAEPKFREAFAVLFEVLSAEFGRGRKSTFMHLVWNARDR